MGIPAAFASLLSWWSAYYADHQAVSVLVRYLHVAAILVGGGTAIAIDRRVMGSRRSDRIHRMATVDAIRAAHRVVVPALALVVASGVLMAVADLATFSGSRLFWIKMSFFALLLINGIVLTGSERAYLRRDGGGPWRRVVVNSGVSMGLWLLILWLGVWLTVAA